MVWAVVRGTVFILEYIFFFLFIIWRFFYIAVFKDVWNIQFQMVSVAIGQSVFRTCTRGTAQAIYKQIHVAVCTLSPVAYKIQVLHSFYSIIYFYNCDVTL